MKILVLSFYFKPDLCAGSFRSVALAEALKRELGGIGEIEVLTTLPNRYSSYSMEAPEEEHDDGVTIRRIALPSHKSGMLDQSRAFLVFAREVMRHVRGQQYDLVFATSSRLMTAVLGAAIARRKRIPLYLDIRDIFVDTIKDVLPRSYATLAKPVFAVMERWAVSGATRVNLVSRGFEEYFTSRYPGQQFSYFTNGIDDEFLPVDEARWLRAYESGPVKVLYAGNLGEGQGLHAIIPDLAEQLRGKVQFTIIGDGGRKGALSAQLEERKIENVELLPPMKRDKLIEAYRSADVLFLHLNDYDAFRKVLPSKLFEYGAMGKPIWAGVAGYAAKFVTAELSNAVVFQPCKADEAVRVFEQLRLRDEPRHEFVRKFARENIAREMALDIMQTLKRGAADVRAG